MAADEAPDSPTFYIYVGMVFVVLGAVIYFAGESILDVHSAWITVVGFVTLAAGVVSTLIPAVAAGVEWGVRRAQL